MTESARCPSLADLLNGDPAYANHVATCPRCRALLRAADLTPPAPTTPGARGAPSRAPTLGGRRRGGPLQPGQVCTVAFSDHDDYLVAIVIETDGADALVAPVTDEVDMATEADLLLDAIVMGYDAMVQTALLGDVLVEQVHDVLVEAGTEVVTSLTRLRAALDTKMPTPTGLATGPAVSGEDDPRLLFREAEREHVVPFYAPAAMLADARTLGELVRSRRDELHVSAADADALLGDADGRTTNLESGTLDLEAEVPATALLALLRDLDVDLHEGTARLVGQAVAARAARAPVQRPMTGLRAINRGPATTSLGTGPRVRAQRYVDALWGAASRAE